MASDFASLSSKIERPDKNEFDFVAFSLILIIPLKSDFDLFLKIDFSTTRASVDGLS